MILDETRAVEYLQFQDLVARTHMDACAAAAAYFELDKAEDLDVRVKSLEQHYDQLVFWRCEEIFDQLPQELVPKDAQELDDLVMFLATLDPRQPIKFKSIS